MKPERCTLEDNLLFKKRLFKDWRTSLYSNSLFDTEFNCNTRTPSVISLVGLRKLRFNNGGKLSPLIRMQWCTKSDDVNPTGMSTKSSCVSALLIFGAELNEPILKMVKIRKFWEKTFVSASMEFIWSAPQIPCHIPERYDYLKQIKVFFRFPATMTKQI